MKKLVFLTLTFLLIVFLTVSCSKNKGSFMDFAAIKDAQRTMTKLTNLMEQYYVENETYPATQEEFVEKIRPYFIVKNAEGQDVDKWVEMVENVFTDKTIHYQTTDPKKTYFAYGRAKDSNSTIVFCRPPLQHIDTTLTVEKTKTKK
ncbi:MAG: hypothetical protein QME48_06100 [bacterium]|uniref:Type II secretion system protein GspG C-terminal domain-containing protein n=2 Tax=Bacteria candidate phyla TaxID=1783234 RepID=A0A101I0K9_UNCT6|nr:MAG: hypothetical protein XD76_0199 [candidate division TA06 bacterium 32_111]KUK86822.1 MAG: hypothetical protein XE03_1185 [candidate division TA06 bacterium 34_109]MDI6700789.1 hypothetical protein [bacterium]HAF07338.1 hypothetical protein [candidate division WOR-3 bacterium]HCP17169.1 hypothetical protein [candidate division WOR-3 bacterium]